MVPSLKSSYVLLLPLHDTEVTALVTGSVQQQLSINMNSTLFVSWPTP
jgi:hypothetical protein